MRTSLLASLVLMTVGCGPTTTAAPPPAHSPIASTPTQVSPSPEASASPAPTVVHADEEAQAPSPCSGEACNRDHLDEIAAAVPRLITDRTAAAAHLHASRAPLARALETYLALADGDTASVQTVLHDEGIDIAAGSPSRLLVGVLMAIRVHLEEATDTASPRDAEVLVPCVLFDAHPREALEAFRPTYGSSRDRIAAGMIRTCLALRADRWLGPDAHAAVDAVDRVASAMWAFAPGPSVGTMWGAVRVAMVEEMERPFFLPVGSERPWTDAALGARLRRLDDHRVTFARRLAAYRATRDAAVPTLSRAICGITHGDGHPVSPAACVRAARATADHALIGWMTNIHGQE